MDIDNKSDIKLYKEQIQVLQEQIRAKHNRINILKQDARNKASLKNYYIIVMCNEYLNISTIACEMNSLSEKYKHTKRDDFLSEARKAFFNALIETEKITGTFIDTPLHENKEILKTIEKIDARRILNLVNKFEHCLNDIAHGYGENSKYKWSFVDMEGRYTTIVKHLLDYKRLAVNDPRDPYYPENVKLLIMIKDKLQAASSSFREKYMLGAKEVVDIKHAIAFQETLKKLHTILGENDGAEMAKKTIDSWNQLLKQEEKRKDEKQKKNMRKKEQG